MPLCCHSKKDKEATGDISVASPFYKAIVLADIKKPLCGGAWGVGGGLVDFAVDVAGEAVDVAAEAGAVGEQAFKPAQALAHCAHHHAHVDHGEQRAHAHYVPQPLAEKGVACHHAERHEAGVDHDFYLVERRAAHAAYRHREAFAGHGHAAAAHLQGYACAEQRAAGELGGGLCGYSLRLEPRGECHVEVDERAEHEAHQQLEQLHWLELAAQHRHLPSHEYAVHHECVLPNAPSRHHAALAGALKHVGQHADHARPEARAHAHCHASRHHPQREQQQCVLPAK